MTPKKKAALCAFGVAVLSTLGAASPLCGLLPAPWQVVCLGGTKVAGVAATRIEVPDAGP